MQLNKHTVFISKNLDPFYNLALGKYFVNQDLGHKKILFLSTSHHGVFVGNNQNCWKECNFSEMEKDKVPLIRRDTGGGTTYVDKGNLLFSFIQNINKQNVTVNYPIVLNALKKLNLDVELKGRNDICMINNQKKISGSAFTIRDNIMRHHGTLLIDVDKQKLTKYLNPNKLKLESKGISSNISRIINLKEIDPDITHSKLENALKQSFYESVNESIDVIEINNNNISNFDYEKFDKIYSQFTNKEFIYNNNPQFTCEFEERFSFGTTQILFNVRNNLILETTIFSDSLDLKLINYIQNHFRTCFNGKNFNLHIFKIYGTEYNSLYTEHYYDQIQEIIDYIIKKFN